MQVKKLLSYSDIMEILERELIDVEKFAYEDFEEEKIKELLGEYELVDSYGGEGQGETWYRVFHFKAHDVYIRVDGWYASYNGTEFYDGWSCCKQVKPEVKQVTVYE